MTKWFEEVANDASNIVSSRVRLSRNWEEYKFPSRLEPDEARTMIARLKQNFRDLGDRDGQFYEYEDLELMEKLDRTALRERRLLNRTLAEKTTPGGILCSEDERVSMVLNADDHIRLQVRHRDSICKNVMQKRMRWMIISTRRFRMHLMRNMDI